MENPAHHLCQEQLGRSVALLRQPSETLPLARPWEWNPLPQTHFVLGTLECWLVLLALGWLVFPWVSGTLDGLKDRGYLVSKWLGLAGLSWLLGILGVTPLPLGWFPR
jgi:hypothetical protein